MSFLKIKRKIVEDPKEIFVLAAKKYKPDEINDPPIFELTQSFVEGKDIDNVVDSSIKNRGSIKTRTFDFEKIRSKLRAENVERGREDKLKVLNHLRKVDDSSAEESVLIIDLRDNTDTDENGNNYVYDLYYSSACIDLPNSEVINEYCLREVNEDLYTKSESEDEISVDDDEDSNDENYWKNEYPDESSESHDDEADADYFLSKQMKKVQLNSDYSLSSDEFDEDVERNCYDFDFHNNQKVNSDYESSISDLD